MKKKVLIVDNNPFFLEVIKEALLPLGYTVETISDPLKAWGCIQKEHFDYILVDHIMPHIDGSRLCRYLKEDPEKAKTPVIIMTGVAIEIANRIKDFNANAYIAKSPIPAFISNIIDVINRFEKNDDVEKLKNNIIGIEKIYPREMTKELIEIENHLSQILYTMNEGVIECNSEYKVFYVNRAALRFLNISERRIIGKNLFKTLGLDKNNEIKSLFPAPSKIKTSDNISEEFCVNLNDKTFCVYINSLQTSTMEKGVLIVLEDVSELFEKINQLSIVNNFGGMLTSELELEEVAEKIVNGYNKLITADTVVFLQNKKSSINEFFVKVVNGLNNRLSPGTALISNIFIDLDEVEDLNPLFISNQKVLSKNFDKIFDEIGYKPAHAIIQPLKFQKHYLGCLLFFNRENPFNDQKKELFQSMAHFSSIALENALRYSKLRDLDIWRQNYMANISHELRTPLTIIKGFNEILCKKIIADDNSKQAILDNMLNEVNRLVRLIDNLLTISKFENIPSFLKIKHSSVDIHSVINKSIEELKKEAEVKKITFIKNFYDKEVKVEGDEELLTQSFYHVLSNAVKYSKTGGKVEVSSTISGNLVYIIIKDYGIGIKQEELPRIFDKFYMIDGGPNRTSRGAGIGLYLVRELINLHYGNVQVDSIYGKGTTFTIKLPLSYREFLQ